MSPAGWRRRNVLSATLAVACALMGACSSGPVSSMTVTVAATGPSPGPVTVYVDSDQRAESGLAGPSTGPTPVRLPPGPSAATVSIPYEAGDWLRVRVAPEPSDPVPVGCELRGPSGRILARDVTGPLERSDDYAHCDGAES